MTSASFKELTRRQRLFRFRSLADKALTAYGLAGAEFRLIQYNENVIYGVFPPQPKLQPVNNEFYFSDRLILRIHATSDEKTIASELSWLDAMANEGQLPVPTPIRTLQGDLQIRVATEGINVGRIVSMLQWMRGRKLEKGIRPVHLQALGRLHGCMIARLHDFSTNWQPPEGF